MKCMIFLLCAVFTSTHAWAKTSLDSLRPDPYRTRGLDINDLGFSDEVIKADPNNQEILAKRSRMLEEHQFWGLIALAGLGLSLLSGGEGELPPEHPFIAGITGGAYAASAYYALAAPDRPPGPSYGQVNWHRWLSWVHLPGMILTPIAGYLAAQQIERGEPLSGLAAQHKNIAGVTAATLAVSTALVAFEF